MDVIAYIKEEVPPVDVLSLTAKPVVALCVCVFCLINCKPDFVLVFDTVTCRLWWTVFHIEIRLNVYTGIILI